MTQRKSPSPHQARDLAALHLCVCSCLLDPFQPPAAGSPDTRQALPHAVPCPGRLLPDAPGLRASLLSAQEETAANSPFAETFPGCASGMPPPPPRQASPAGFLSLSLIPVQHPLCLTQLPCSLPPQQEFRPSGWGLCLRPCDAQNSPGTQRSVRLCGVQDERVKRWLGRQGWK